jgi:hypothetical protein
MDDELLEDAVHEQGLRNLASGRCYHCGEQITWQPDNHDASDEGSFVDQAGCVTCPNTNRLHQG